MPSISTLAFAAVVTAFALGHIAVFVLGADRGVVADLLALTYSTMLPIGCGAPLLDGGAWRMRLGAVATTFVAMSAITHLTWEAGWLVFREAIAASPTAPWAYSWWAYIDGGDTRYAQPDNTLLVVMEGLSVCNGVLGASALGLYASGGRYAPLGVLGMMAMAVVHLYSVALYYATELIDGLPSVGDSVFDLGFKFILANAPWLVFPPVVIVWGIGELLPTIIHHPHCA